MKKKRKEEEVGEVLRQGRRVLASREPELKLRFSWYRRRLSLLNARGRIFLWLRVPLEPNREPEYSSLENHDPPSSPKQKTATTPTPKPQSEVSHAYQNSDLLCTPGNSASQPAVTKSDLSP